MNRSGVVPLNILDKRSPRAVAAESTILLLINVVGILGNFCLCVAVYRGVTLRGTCTKILIVALSVADLVVSLVAMPMSASALICGKWYFTNLGCQVQGFIVHLLAFISLQVMAITAFSRYLRVIRPSCFQKLFTKKRTLGMVIFSFSLSSAFLVFLTFRRGASFIFHPHKALCVMKFRSILDSRLFTVVTGVTFVLTPAAVIITCYSKIFHAIRHHNRNMSKHALRARSSIDTGSTVLSTTRLPPQDNVPQCNADTSSERENWTVSTSSAIKNTLGALKLSAAEIKITKTIFVLILAFATCWIPCFTIDIIDTQISGWLDRKLYLTYTILAYLSSAVNPLIYGGMASSSLEKKRKKWVEDLRRRFIADNKL